MRESERAFRDLLAALNGAGSADSDLNLDPGRVARTGVPEVVLALGKTVDQVLAAARGLLAANGRVIVSRVTPELVDDLRAAFPSYEVRWQPEGRTALLAEPLSSPARTDGFVGILAAGAADVPVAEEAAIMAREMGCRVDVIADVGVAGLHRLFPPLRRLLDAGVDAIIVAAGMDGALPSVVAGLVAVPVIGLPTSAGYGFGGHGEGALMSMLQTCVPGLSVVNVDNGVGAGAAAALIANAAARGRRERA